MTTASLTYKVGMTIGTGAYGLVSEATEENTGRVVALKQVRAPLRVKRTLLQHEARVLQSLQGHPAIPVMYGYGRFKHFEYLAMEFLGPSIREKWPGSSASIPLKTVVVVIQQVLSALEHIHKRGFIHRDIKPENILCSPDNPARIKLIDFNLSNPISASPPNKVDPISQSRTIMGTVHWASLNSMNGVDLSPRDDLESLSYVALFLVRSDLPWRNGPRYEPMKRSIQRVRQLKAQWTGATLGVGFESEFGELLDYSRALAFNQIPDYKLWSARFADLALRLGVISGEPLDWTPGERPIASLQAGDSEVLSHNIPDEDEKDLDSDDDEDGLDQFQNSYYGNDIDCWDFIQGERSQELTMPLESRGTIDLLIPRIAEVFTGVHVYDLVGFK
ncbi:hypothetical protein M413DRAFT_25639 [Hebeloma cylindrosporum]|uniref:non-specific serine/threonine protein kinase n=1 Tax=Hebeloma cylindrosporum TaxID=76867 RepID=A0A0C2Y2Z0_HEBCY|nr:hypothetical protein M413DRAFT_25639 [Hebeloma cylindrosporum h7]